MFIIYITILWLLSVMYGVVMVVVVVVMVMMMILVVMMIMMMMMIVVILIRLPGIFKRNRLLV